MTHDLLLHIITDLDAKLKYILVDNLENNTFYAKLVVEDKEGAEHLIDARPSDSIALALRAEVPIFVENSVLADAGIGGEV